MKKFSDYLEEVSSRAAEEEAYELNETKTPNLSKAFGQTKGVEALLEKVKKTKEKIEKISHSEKTVEDKIDLLILKCLEDDLEKEIKSKKPDFEKIKKEYKDLPFLKKISGILQAVAGFKEAQKKALNKEYL